VVEPGDDKVAPQRFEIERTGKDDKVKGLRVSDSFAQAAVFGEPTATAKRRTAFQLFNIFFVYAETKEFVLLGTNQQLKDNVEVVRGWIPKGRVAFWTTREAVEWDQPSTLEGKRKKQGAILKTLDSATKWDDGDKVPEEDLLFTEFFTDKGVSKGYKYDDPRFPCLDTQNEPGFSK